MKIYITLAWHSPVLAQAMEELQELSSGWTQDGGALISCICACEGRVALLSMDFPVKPVWQHLNQPQRVNALTNVCFHPHVIRISTPSCV